MPDPQRDNSTGRFATPPAVRPPSPDVLTATRTGDQSGGGGGIIGGPYVGNHFDAYGFACEAANPCGFPGFGGPWPGTFGNYRLMLSHPVLRFVRSIVTAPIVQNVWAIEPAREDLPAQAESWKRHLEAVLLPQRKQLIRIGIHAHDMGAGFGEKVWTVRDGRYWAAVKWLSNDLTEVVTDRGGNFIGLSQPGVDGNAYAGYGADGRPIPGLGPFKAFKITHDYTPDAGHYGRSWLENVRDYAWRPWLNTMSRLQRLGDKLAGTIGILFGPAGEFKDAKTGLMVSYRDMAAAAIKAIKAGQFGYFPTVALSAQDASGKVDLDRLAALIKTSLVSLQVVDFGNHAPAIGGMLAELDHYEGLMFNGGLRSTRTGMESKYGSRADATQHTDSGVEEAEGLDDDIAEQVNTGLVDDILTLNGGEGARGSFRITAPPLTNERMAQLREFLRLMMSNPVLAVALAKAANVDEVMRALDIPALEEFEAPDAAVKEDEPEGGAVRNGGRMVGANGN